MASYTSELKQKLRDDIAFIDSQLDLAREKMAQGDKAEAWSLLDGLLGYFDFKKHFPDIFVNENESIRFQDFYENLRAIDDLIEIDATDSITGDGQPPEWRPGYTRAEILQRLRAFLDQIDAWLGLNWFEGEEIRRRLEALKEKVETFIRFFENYSGEHVWTPVIAVRDAKMMLWRALSENLPFAEVYELLMAMDRNLTYLVFRFRLHLDELTPESVAQVIQEIAKYKHAILAIINATRSDDEILQQAEDENAPKQPPPGWDDLQPFPPAGYAFFGGGIVPIQASRRTGITYLKGNSPRLRMAALVGFVLGALAASVLALLTFNANCPQ